MNKTKQVKDLQAEQYTVTQSTEECSYTLDLLGFKDKWIKEFGCLIMWQDEGDYKEIWGLSNNIPYLELYAELIYKNGKVLLK